MNEVIKAEIIDGSNRVLGLDSSVQNSLDRLRAMEKEVQWYCKIRVTYNNGEKLLLSVRKEQR